MTQAQKTQQVVTCAIVPSYNSGDLLIESVQSLLSQTIRPNRIIVIDDASTDDSIRSIVDLETSGKIEIVRNTKNLGKARSLNNIFDSVECDYFILQDADDIALPERVERQIAFMKANPSVGCSSAFVQYISIMGRPIGRGQLDLVNNQVLEKYLNSDEPFGLFCPSAIIKADVVKSKNLQFRGQFWPADDIDLWNRIAEAGWPVLAQPEILVKYRIHGTSVVTSSFIRTRMQFEWVRASLRARRCNKPEPTHDEFLKDWNAVPFLRKINRTRKIHSKGNYRAAGFSFAERKYLRTITHLLLASILDPKYALPRLAQQVGLQKIKNNI